MLGGGDGRTSIGGHGSRQCVPARGRDVFIFRDIELRRASVRRFVSAQRPGRRYQAADLPYYGDCRARALIDDHASLRVPWWALSADATALVPGSAAIAVLRGVRAPRREFPQSCFSRSRNRCQPVSRASLLTVISPSPIRQRTPFRVCRGASAHCSFQQRSSCRGRYGRACLPLTTTSDGSRTAHRTDN